MAAERRYCHAGTLLRKTQRPDALPVATVAVIKRQGLPTELQGIDMPKAHLRLIRCSDDVKPETNRRDRRFQPTIIDGGRRTNVVQAENPWEGLSDLFNLGLLIAQANYLTFVAASLNVLEHHARAAAERTTGERGVDKGAHALCPPSLRKPLS